LEKAKDKVFKLALPFECEIDDSGSIIIIKDKFGNRNFIPCDYGSIFSVGGIDRDGFVLFTLTHKEMKKQQPKQTILPQSKAHMNGYALFHTNLSKSFGYGGLKSVFEYYKKDSDLSYYLIVKKEGKPDRKLLLGSLRESTSRIFQVASIIHEKFPRDKKFDKTELTQYLPSSLNGARIVKGTLDILTKEGYLIAGSGKFGKKNKTKEIFSKTETLEKYLADPRSWQKPNGLNIGS
jgi:hypothetical protein